MSKSHANHRRDCRHRRTAAPAADGLTIGWATTFVSAIVCELAAAAARGYVRFVNPEGTVVGVLSGLMWFAAAVLGVLLLVMTPAVVWRRRSHPPRLLVWGAYAVAVAPWGAMLMQAFGE